MKKEVWLIIHLLRYWKWVFLEKLGLSSADKFNYLKGGNCFAIDGLDDADEFESLKVKMILGRDFC